MQCFILQEMRGKTVIVSVVLGSLSLQSHQSCIRLEFCYFSPDSKRKIIQAHFYTTSKKKKKIANKSEMHYFLFGSRPK